MAYATVEDMRRVLGADTLALIAGEVVDGVRVVDDALVQSALEEAQSLARTYLLSDPPDPVPPVLRRATVTLAEQYLRPPRNMCTEDSTQAAAAVLRWLEAIATGKALLVAMPDAGAPAEDAALLDPGDPETDGLDRVWSRESARWVF